MRSSLTGQRKATGSGAERSAGLPACRLGATLPSIVERLQLLGVRFIIYREASLPKNLREGYWRDCGPRLGFAYRLGDDPRPFILRGGYRISYFPIPMYTWGQRMRMNAPLTARFITSLTDPAQAPDGIGAWSLRSVPAVVAGQNSRDAVTLANGRTITRGSPLASYFAREQPDARVRDWNLTIEKEVMADTVARVSYVGNHGSHLEQFYSYTEPTPDYIWYVTTGERLPTGEYAGVARRAFDKEVWG